MALHETSPDSRASRSPLLFHATISGSNASFGEKFRVDQPSPSTMALEAFRLSNKEFTRSIGNIRSRRSSFELSQPAYENLELQQPPTLILPPPLEAAQIFTDSMIYESSTRETNSREPWKITNRVQDQSIYEEDARQNSRGFDPSKTLSHSPLIKRNISLKS